MKVVAVITCVALIAGAAVAVFKLLPLFLNSKVTRVHEKNLPRIQIENGSAIYCRMKADDFRFPLPPGSRATNLTVTGGFDSVDGSVEALFESTNRITASEYEKWLAGKVAVGGQVRAKTIPGGLLINFHYFGDR